MAKINPLILIFLFLFFAHFLFQIQKSPIFVSDPLLFSQQGLQSEFVIYRNVDYDLSFNVSNSNIFRSPIYAVNGQLIVPVNFETNCSSTTNYFTLQNDESKPLICKFSTLTAQPGTYYFIINVTAPNLQGQIRTVSVQVK